MTKKDFELVASVIANQPKMSANLRAANVSVLRSFVDRFETDFPRFDRYIFVRACGMVMLQDDKSGVQFVSYAEDIHGWPGCSVVATKKRAA